ncbi:MAG TPA: hypothetical protein VLM89_16010 [Phycisphaerae bacterium]|nr:hypothetical protein [Phycisphaerae bacterium]
MLFKPAPIACLRRQAARHPESVGRAEGPIGWKAGVRVRAGGNRATGGASPSPEITPAGRNSTERADVRRRTSNHARKATVLILVIGVLAMLFIVGSTLLIVARFEKQTAEKYSYGQNLDALLEAALEPTLMQIREDVVGNNGMPYDRPWSPNEDSTIEDSEDFPGLATGDEWRIRSGDLLTGSVAPYLDTSNNNWYFRWSSWALDGPPADYTAEQIDSNIGWVRAFLTHGAEARGSDNPDVGRRAFDVSGDGIRDLGNSMVLGTTANMFGPGYAVGIRVVPHGGMVLIDPFTHPLLLAQVIHPSDPYHNDPQRLWAVPDALSVSSADEGRLRRRFMLPANLGTNMSWSDLDKKDLRYKLPITLGYEAPSGAPAVIKDLLPHWWPVDSRVVATSNYTDDDWWQKRLNPPAKAPTEPGYNAATDVYDRRHLITTVGSDDVLRVQREESRLSHEALGQFADPGDPNPNKHQFGKALAPQKDVITDRGWGLTPIPPYPLTGSLPPLPVATFRLLDANIPYLPGPPITYTDRFFDYGRDDEDGVPRFNVPGLRTQFSLRDVLDPYTGQGTYQKAVQLTAYFLAMMQHTNLPLSDTNSYDLDEYLIHPPSNQTEFDGWQLEQLEAAAQLAVNAIDFADDDGNVDNDPRNIPDQVNTCFEWPAGNPRFKVVGVEKQPYITEAYVKIILPAEDPGTGLRWKKDVDASSIYAVELYNPYPVPLSLKGYKLNDAVLPGAGDLGELLKDYDNTAGTGARSAGLALSGAMPPYGYIVLVRTPGSDLVDPATGQPFLSGPGIVEGENLFLAPTLRIRPGDNVALIRTNSRILTLRPEGFEFPGTQDDPGATDPVVRIPAEMEVDELTASRKLGSLDLEPWDNEWAGIPFARITDNAGTYEADMIKWPVPTDSADVFVRDSSLQRHKEAPGLPPVFWHFTLSAHGQFPPRAYEGYLADGTPMAGGPPKDELGGLATCDQIGYPLSYTVGRPRQHCLLGTRHRRPGAAPAVGTPQGPDRDSQDLIAAEFLGLSWTDHKPFAGSYSAITIGRDGNVPCGGEGPPIAPFPVVTADRGISQLTGGTLAFPTTGSLLLVTRYAHMDKSGPATETLCVPARATRVPPGVNRNGLEQLQQLDNGHLPIFDTAQWTRDVRDDAGNVKGAPQSRLDQPWGQLIWNYFTALPLEELTRRYDFDAMETRYRDIYGAGTNPQLAGLGNNTRMVGLAGSEYERVYSVLFPYYPLMDPVSEAAAETGSPLGPKVRGRINVNYAPWWVLDGLPVLPDGLLGTNSAIPTNSVYPLAGLPVIELATDQLDPQAYLGGSPPYDPAAKRLLEMLFDPGNAAAGKMIDYLPSVSPTLARYMVSYRENRPVDGLNAGSTQPGIVNLGHMCNVVAAIPLTLSSPSVTKTLGELRLHVVNPGNNAVKPHAYLGWLQFVAPLVRLEDWATVKNHVFTVFATVGDNSDPPMWMRKQMTVDRTACLYKSELPQKITETPPIAYQNAVDDK